MSSAHLDPTASYGEKSHQAQELGESPSMAGAGRASPQPGQEGDLVELPVVHISHHRPHLSLGRNGPGVSALFRRSLPGSRAIPAIFL